jgi:two-component sensor histidine kinase
MPLARALRAVRRRPLAGSVLALALLGAAVGIRLTTPITLSYVTFYPAVMIATVAGGIWLGAAVTLGATVAAVYLFVPRVGSFALRETDVWNVGAFWCVCALLIVATDLLVKLLDSETERANKIAVLYQRLADTESARQTVMRELSHRMKNQYAVIIAMARMSQGTSGSVAEFQSAFTERLFSLSRAHDLLMKAEWKPVSLTDLIRSELEPFSVPGRLEMRGAAFRLKEDAVAYFTMALHELATNCAKHGAWRADGKVTLEWSMLDGRFMFTWQDDGGQIAQPCGRRGFGSKILETITPAALQGDGTIEFGPNGLRWVLNVPCGCVEAYSGTGALRSTAAQIDVPGFVANCSRMLDQGLCAEHQG